MTKYPFQLLSDEDLIIINAWIEGYKIRLAVDTAATHTTVDFNILLMLGYSEKDTTGAILIETANGIMEVKKYLISDFRALDKEKSNFEIVSYDFLEKGILSMYDGVLGLDFLSQTVLTIDFIKQEIWLNQAK